MMRHLVGAQGGSFLSVNCREGFYDPDASGKRHVGTWPWHMQGFAQQRCFRPWLQMLLQELAFKQSRPGLPPAIVHILLWCNKGCHRSVSASRVLEAVADRYGWPSPAHTYFVPSISKKQAQNHCQPECTFSLSEVSSSVAPVRSPVDFAKKMQHVPRVRCCAFPGLLVVPRSGGRGRVNPVVSCRGLLHQRGRARS